MAVSGRIKDFYIELYKGKCINYNCDSRSFCSLYTTDRPPANTPLDAMIIPCKSCKRYYPKQSVEPTIDKDSISNTQFGSGK